MKQIKYDKYTSLENCEDEPIHLIGTIQPIGCLLVFDLKTREISFISENCAEYIGTSLKEVIEWSAGKCFQKISLGKTWSELETWLKHNKTFRINNLQLNVLVDIQCYLYQGYMFIELEKSGASTISDHDFLDQSRQFIQLVNQSENFKDFSALVADNIRGMTGYDRVMIYRFDSDFNGEVYAESKQQVLEPFLGLHYPHTDIPKQARALYKKNLIRLLVDVEKPSVPVYAKDDQHNYSNLDLGQSILRSASPVHLMYLKNMGVTATLTISIMIDQQLWGLISCHHYSARHIDYDCRLAAQLQTDFYASQIRKWQRSDEYALVQEKEHIYQAIIEDAINTKNLFKFVTQLSYFKGLTFSDGGAVIRNREVYLLGATPSEEQVLELHDLMKGRGEQVFLSNTLSKQFSQAKKYSAIASGILYYCLDRDSDSAIIWFRKELAEGKKWGGRVAAKEGRTPLTPRNSFTAWEEKVDGVSEKWKSYEIQSGLRLCAFMEREIYIKNLKKQKKEFQLLSEELKKTNEELSQFNWISSHDMKEPLRKIRMFVDQIKQEEDLLTETHQLYFSRIDTSAERMQKLIDDLLNYAGLTKHQILAKINLTDLLNELINELDIEEHNIDFDLPDLGDFELIDFQIKQLFSNLINNSIKFRKKKKLQISFQIEDIDKKEVKSIRLNEKLKYKKIIYIDNGIGFLPKYNERIFELFQRLNDQNKYEGTGIGLAICKKIVESHKGAIKAYGNEGEGVKFDIILPVSPS